MDKHTLHQRMLALALEARDNGHEHEANVMFILTAASMKGRAEEMGNALGTTGFANDFHAALSAEVVQQHRSKFRLIQSSNEDQS